jgi:hypothetical protein
MVNPAPSPVASKAESLPIVPEAIGPKVVIPEAVVNEVQHPEPIDDGFEETCCSWDYDLGDDGDCWD